MSRKRRSYESGHKPKYLVVIDDSADEWIDCAKFLSKAKYSPFHGRRVAARVELGRVGVWRPTD